MKSANARHQVGQRSGITACAGQPWRVNHRCKSYLTAIMVLGIFSSTRDIAAEDDLAMERSPAAAVEDNQLLLNQIAEIRGQIARLQAAVQQLPRDKPAAPGMASDMGSGPGAMAVLPAFQGTPHLYHVGSSDLFLDYSAKVGLTSEQKIALMRIKKDTVLQISERQRQIDQAEKELLTLAASAQPDDAQIQSKLAESALIRADLRLYFIRQVGEAARMLSDGQRRRLSATVATQ
ncbi:MAG: periplasmic heavy metal sensor [Elusimicrobiota bacterium]|nr:MAG: periplasmic heavy metal sensor [Elusimicrobiota bacterium]